MIWSHSSKTFVVKTTKGGLRLVVGPRFYTLSLNISLHVYTHLVADISRPTQPVVHTYHVTLHALTMKKNYPKKVEACRFAYTSYQKMLNTLRGYLRGKEFHKNILLFETNRLDDLVIDMCSLIPDKLSRKYYKRFKVNLPRSCSGMRQVVPPSYRAVVGVVRETSIY